MGQRDCHNAGERKLGGFTSTALPEDQQVFAQAVAGLRQKILTKSPVTV